MPAKIVSFFHHSVVPPEGASPSDISVTTSFGAALKHEHDLRAGATPGVAGQRFRERLEGIRVRLSAVGSATKITVKVTLDPLGNDIVVPDTEATIATGVSTAAKGAVAFSVKLPIYQSASGEVGKLYVFLKADAACTVDQTTVTWTET
jgi:hypothetical protein